jgi:hypothetical protein
MAGVTYNHGFSTWGESNEENYDVLNELSGFADCQIDCDEEDGNIHVHVQAPTKGDAALIEEYLNGRLI